LVEQQQWEFKGIFEKYILTDQIIDFANLTLDVALLSNPKIREPRELTQGREARSDRLFIGPADDRVSDCSPYEQGYVKGLSRVADADINFDPFTV
jgi:hypothetical protein